MDLFCPKKCESALNTHLCSFVRSVFVLHLHFSPQQKQTVPQVSITPCVPRTPIPLPLPTGVFWGSGGNHSHTLTVTPRGSFGGYGGNQQLVYPVQLSKHSWGYFGGEGTFVSWGKKKHSCMLISVLDSMEKSPLPL